MPAIASRVARILMLRWLRSWGYRGVHPTAVMCLLSVGAVALAALAAGVLHSWAAEISHADAELRRSFVAVVVMIAYFLAGPALLLTASLASAGSRLRATLASLPLTLREIAAVVALPLYALAAAVVVGLAWLTAAALSGTGLAPAQAIAAAALACMCGYALAGLILACLRLALPGLRAHRLDYPLAVVLWLALFVAQDLAVQPLFHEGHVPWSARVLLAPWIAESASRSTISPAEWLAVAGVLVLSLQALLRSGGEPASPGGVVAWRWRSTWRPALETLELTRLLRSRVLLANLVAAAVLELALLAAVASTPAQLRADLVRLLLPAAAIIAALPLLLLRGGTSSRPPVPLLLGYRAARWVSAQLIAGFVSAVLLFVPLLAGLAIVAPGSFTVTTGAAYLVATVGVALGISWLAPTSPDNPLGQAVTGFFAFCSTSALLVMLNRLAHEDSLLWTLVMLLVGIAGCATAVWSERRMWSRQNRPVRERRGRARRVVRRRVRVTPAYWFVLIAALLFAGLIYATAQVQSSPVDTRFDLRLWVVPFFESFRRSGHIGLRVEWGTVAALAGPIVATLLFRVRQLMRLTSGSAAPTARRDSSPV